MWHHICWYVQDQSYFSNDMDIHLYSHSICNTAVIKWDGFSNMADKYNNVAKMTQKHKHRVLVWGTLIFIWHLPAIHKNLGGKKFEHKKIEGLMIQCNGKQQYYTPPHIITASTITVNIHGLGWRAFASDWVSSKTQHTCHGVHV